MKNKRILTHDNAARLAWLPFRDLFRKMVPTDLNWSPTLAGGFCRVGLNCCGALSWNVSVYGGDDCGVCVFFPTFDEAVELYHSLCYISSDADLAAFEGSDGNNGWPGPADIPESWTVWGLGYQHPDPR